MKIKDPSAKLDYSFDWSLYLDSATIKNSSFSADSNDLTLTDDITVDNISTVFVSGGIAGKVYTITNTITFDTNGAEATEERSLQLFIEEQ